MAENLNSERILLGPLVAAPENAQRQRRALLISVGGQLALILLLAFWPQPQIVPLQPRDPELVQLNFPILHYTAPVKTRLEVPARRLRPPLRPIIPPPTPPQWRHLVAPASVALARPRAMSEPGPLRLQPPAAMPAPALAPAFPTPKVGAEPVQLNRFAAAAAAPAPQAAPGVLKAGGFGGPQTQAIQPPASGPVHLAGFAGAQPTTAGSAAGHVHTGGFGTSLAAGTAPSRGAAGSLASAGFDLTALPTAPAPASAATAAPAYIPVEILFKPVPQYSAEGRELGIQGDVVLAVLFQIDGHLRVARVVHGLGHGLDQAAVRAAQEIRFRPAQRNGAAVETAALIRVTFELAQ